MKTIKKTVLFLIVFLSGPAAAFSHPHQFIDATVLFHTHHNTITGIRYSWTFDDMFSRLIFTDFDLDKDQRLSEKEISRIKKYVFDNLSHYNYFTYIEDLVFHTALDFTVTMQPGVLPVNELLTVFSPDHVNRLKEYLNQNRYINDDDHILEIYQQHTDTIKKWMRINLDEEAEQMIRYLDFSTGKRMAYSFMLPLSRPVPIEGLKLTLMDKTNYTAIEIKKVAFDKDNPASYTIKDTTIILGKGE